MSNPKLNDVGVVIERTLVTPKGVVIPLGGASGLKLWLKYPDETITYLTAVLSTDGSDGKIRRVSQAGDLSQAGTYQAMFYYELGGSKLHSDRFEFRVEDVIG